MRMKRILSKKTKSSILSVLLAICLLITLFPLSASADENVSSGTCGKNGDNLMWTLDGEGVLTISGTGEMADWDGDETNAPWYDISYYVAKIVIEEGVTSIGDSAFEYCAYMTDVVIPETVTTIGDDAFFDCFSMTSIALPSSLKTIGEQAFVYCDSLSTLSIPEGVTSIGYCCFGDCSSLASVSFPASLYSIDENLFYGCSSLKEITVASDNAYFCDEDGILFSKDKTVLYCFPAGREDEAYTVPDEVKTIGSSAFSNCSNLTSIVLNEGLTTIKDWAFSICTGIESISIPASVENTGVAMFSRSTSLKEIAVADGSSNYCSVDGILFNVDKTELICYPAAKEGISYTVPDSVSKIRERAFAYNDRIESIEIPDEITCIENCTFYACTGLKSVNIPYGVTYIGDMAFDSCTSLLNITIPESVKSIGKNAFELCSSITSINIPGSVETVGKCAFEYCYALESATIGEGVKDISDYMFYDCEALKSVSLPSTLKTIGYESFAYCALESINIPSKVSSIGVFAFGGCTYLDRIKIASDNHKYRSFKGVLFTKDFSALICYPSGIENTSYKVPYGVKKLDEGAFYGSNYLESVTIPSSVKTIGDSAFGYCYKLNDVLIPNKVRTIENWAFYGCESLNLITIPASVKNIGMGILDYCADGLTVRCYKNSSAYTYANDNGFAIELIRKGSAKKYSKSHYHKSKACHSSSYYGFNPKKWEKWHDSCCDFFAHEHYKLANMHKGYFYH